MGSWSRLPSILYFLEVIIRASEKGPVYGALLSCCKGKVNSCIVKVPSILSGIGHMDDFSKK